MQVDSSQDAERDPASPDFWVAALGGDATAERLVRDGAIAKAIQSRRPSQIHAAMENKFRHAKSPGDHAALWRALENRRLFAEPIRKAPGMSTVNGIGMRLSGAQDRDPQDGSYISTLFFTLLFIPIWPVRQYLVSDAGRGAWSFQATVPMSRLHKRWRKIVAGVGIAGALLIGLNLLNRETSDEVHFLNGLEVPVTIAGAGDSSFIVQPQGMITRELDSGSHHILVRDKGTVLEELDVDVPGGTDLVVYNVLGAAPLYVNDVAYAGEDVSPAEAEARSRFASLAGPTWVVRDDVDYVFENPPETVPLGRKGEISLKRSVGMGAGGWRSAVGHLATDGKMGAAAALARRIALLESTARDALYWAHELTLQEGNEKLAEKFASQAITVAPESIDAHRVYQTHMEKVGRSDEILPTYKAAYEAQSDSLKDGYLYARLAPLAESQAILERLLPQHPDSRWLHRGLSWTYMQGAEYEKAIPHYEKLLELEPQGAGGILSLLARAYAGAGRPKEGLDAIRAMFEAAPARMAKGGQGIPGGTPFELAWIYASLVRLVPSATEYPGTGTLLKPFFEGEPDPAVLADIAAFARDEPWIKSLLPRVKSEALLERYRLVLLAQQDVEQAARGALAATDETLTGIDDLAQIVMACELHRLGHADKARSVLAGLSPETADELTYDHIKVLPDVSGLSRDLPIGPRAAMLFSASRRTEDAARKSELLARARRYDVLARILPR